MSEERRRDTAARGAGARAAVRFGNSSDAGPTEYRKWPNIHNTVLGWFGVLSCPDDQWSWDDQRAG